MLLNLRDGQALHRLEGHSSDVVDVAFSPDGAHALSAGSLDRSVRVFRVATGDVVRVIDTGAPVLSMAVSPSGRVGVACENLMVFDWASADASVQVIVLDALAQVGFAPRRDAEGRETLYAQSESRLVKALL